MWKLAPALMAASALHVAAWVGLSVGAPVGASVGKQGHADAQATTPARPVALSWQVRQVQIPAKAQAAHELQAAELNPAQPAFEPTVALASTPMQTPAQALDAPSAEITMPEAAAPPPPDTQADAHTDPHADPYWPRPQLSRPPVPRTVVAIAFPAGVPTPGRHTAVLALYIDEAGHVQRVDTSDAQLPGAYIEAARDAFLVTRFEPGEIQGRAVKSLIHVEVQFDQAEAGPQAEPARLTRTFAGLP